MIYFQHLIEKTFGFFVIKARRTAERKNIIKHAQEVKIKLQIQNEAKFCRLLHSSPQPLQPWSGQHCKFLVR